MQIVVGLIGGTGLDQDDTLLKDKQLVELAQTPYGHASDTHALKGTIEGVCVYILSRHGRAHDVSPSHVNYRANLWTLVKQLECTHILATSACGSLREHIMPGHIGVLDQYIDRTCCFRDRSFYKVAHVEQRAPVDATLQRFIVESCKTNDVPCHDKLTCVTIEGPRFSTYAESQLHRSWGCDVVNMTSVPEVPLATELATIYACIMLITDYDSWRDEGESVSSNLVLERMKELGVKAKKIIPGVIKKIAEHDWTNQIQANLISLENSIMHN